MDEFVSATPPEDSLPAWPLALAVGLLLGVERGWRHRDEEAGAPVAGIRTFALLGLLGGLAGFAARSGSWGLAVTLIAGAIGALLVGFPPTFAAIIISGRDVAVRAQIRRIDSYSAHADRSEPIAWIEARGPVRGSLFLTDGEEQALEALKRDLESGLPSILIPEIGERYELPAGAPAKRPATGRVELREALNRDWQNDYADLVVNLKRELQQIRSDRQRAEALARMRDVIDRYATHGEKHRRAG